MVKKPILLLSKNAWTVEGKEKSLSLSPSRQTGQTKELVFFSSVKVERVEQVEVRCGYTVEVVQKYLTLTMPPKKTTYLFSD